MSMILTDVRSGEQERSPQLQTGNSRSFSLAYGCGWPQQKKAGGLLGGLFAKGG